MPGALFQEAVEPVLGIGLCQLASPCHAARPRGSRCAPARSGRLSGISAAQSRLVSASRTSCPSALEASCKYRQRLLISWDLVAGLFACHTWD